MPYTVNGKACNTGRTRFKKGVPSWSAGKKLPQFTGENAKHWSGDNIGYHGLHAWIRKELGRPSICSHCVSTTEKRYEWANISGKYTRELIDWIRLCRKCHIKYDKQRGLWGKSNARKPRGVVLS